MGKKTNRKGLRIAGLTIAKRRVVQVLSLLALHSSWGPELKWLCVPVLSCHSCSLAWFACPVGVFVHYSAYGVFPYLAVGTMLLFGVLVGRLFCGWACPFGFLQDMLHKIPSPKFVLPAWTSYLKYVVLVVMVLAIPFFFTENHPLTFCRICPASALQVTIPVIVGSGATSLKVSTIVKLAILVVILITVVFSSRAFCKTMCPIAAMLAPLNHVCAWVVRAPKATCVHCERCDDVCPTHVRPSDRMGKGKPPSRALDCILCHECQKPCPGFIRDKRAEES